MELKLIANKNKLITQAADVKDSDRFFAYEHMLEKDETPEMFKEVDFSVWEKWEKLHRYGNDGNPIPTYSGLTSGITTYSGLTINNNK